MKSKKSGFEIMKQDTIDVFDKISASITSVVKNHELMDATKAWETLERFSKLIKEWETFIRKNKALVVYYKAAYEAYYDEDKTEDEAEAIGNAKADAFIYAEAIAEGKTEAEAEAIVKAENEMLAEVDAMLRAGPLGLN